MDIVLFFCKIKFRDAARARGICCLPAFCAPLICRFACIRLPYLYTPASPVLYICRRLGAAAAEILRRFFSAEIGEVSRRFSRGGFASGVFIGGVLAGGFVLTKRAFRAISAAFFGAKFSGANQILP